MNMNIQEYLSENYPDEEFIILEGFDDCVIGIDINNFRLIYSVDDIIKVLCRDMSEEDAIEYYNHNIGCSYMGEHTPIFSHSL